MTQPSPSSRPLGRAFWRIWSAQTVSTLGSSVAGFGIAVHVFLDSGNATWLGLLMAAAGLPFVVLAPLLGRIDRFERRAVMITGDLIAAVGTIVALALAIRGTLEAWHLVIAAIVGGIGTAIQMPAAQAAIPALVEPDQLDRANGLGQIGPAGGIVVAPVIATMLVAQWDITAVLIVDVVTFAIAVATTALTPFRSHLDRCVPSDADVAGDDGRDPIAGWAPVIDWMRTSGRGVAALMAVAATVNLCLGFFNVALVAVVATIDEHWAGLPLAVGGIAMIGASIVIGRRGLPQRRVPTITLGVFMLAAGCAICGLRPSLAVVAIGAAIALAAVPIVNSAASTMLHERVPSTLQGRVFALRGGISRSLDPLGAAAAGIVISVLAEPAMSTGGALEGTVGRVLSTGDGRGAALVMIFVGLALAVIATAVRSSTSLRHLDTSHPAGVDGQVEPDQSQPVGSVV